MDSQTIRRLEFWTELFGLKVGDRVMWRTPFTIPQSKDGWYYGTIKEISKRTISIKQDHTDFLLYFPTRLDREERRYFNKPLLVLVIE